MRYSTELAVCMDCVYLLANGQPESVEPSWHPDFDLAELRAGRDFGAELAAIDAHAAAVEAAWPDHDVTLGSLECEYCGIVAHEADPDTTTDCEAWFSHSACDLCDSSLGGDREHAVATPNTLAAMIVPRFGRTVEQETVIQLLQADRANVLAAAAYDHLESHDADVTVALRDLADTIAHYVEIGEGHADGALEGAWLEAMELVGWHSWQRAWMTGTKTCERCGLLPLDADDESTNCPGRPPFLFATPGNLAAYAQGGGGDD